MKFRVTTDRLTPEQQTLHAEDIVRLTQRYKEELYETLHSYACPTHGEQLEVEIILGPGPTGGVAAGYELHGCCEAFVSDVYDDLRGDDEEDAVY